MKRRSFSLSQLSCLIGLTLLLSACNLGTAQSDAYVTMVPRATATPPPTLGVESGGQLQQPDLTLGGVQTPVVDPSVEIKNLLNQVDPERMRAHIQYLQNVQTRHILSSQTGATGIGAAQRYIEEQFRLISDSSGGNLTVPTPHAFTAYNTATQSATNYNVFAYIQGSETNAGIYVIGAHYDSVGPNLKDPTIAAPGANDNGSGVAGMLEIARILSQRRYRATLIFVAFSAEEHERQGSKAFVNDIILGSGMDVLGMINIDSIGNADDNSGNIDDHELSVYSDDSNSSQSRQMARMAEMISDYYGLDMRLEVETSRDREGRYGDHFSFSDAGVPAIRFINTLEQWPNASANDLIQYIEFDYLTRATQSIMMFVLTVADGPRLPRCDIVLRPVQNDTQTLIWNPLEDATGYMVFFRLADSLHYDGYVETLESRLAAQSNLFSQYGAITVAARGRNGIIGPFCDEYLVGQQFVASP